ncbi:hypothetical protein NG726_41965, partial [Pseudomonas sp. MOB-449]|nr:hypothetical protein [Pseudomonas sp. MOB-449]
YFLIQCLSCQQQSVVIKSLKLEKARITKADILQQPLSSNSTKKCEFLSQVALLSFFTNENWHFLIEA